MNTQEFLAKHAAGETDFSGLDLREIYLTDSSIPKNEFRLIFLTEDELNENILKFTGSDLTQVTINYSYLGVADFSYSNLSQGDLRYNDLENVNFSHANLELANLSYSRLSKANFYQTNLHNANLSHTSLYKTNFRDGNLINTDLSYSYLYETDFTGVDLSSVNLEGTSLFNAKLADAINVPEWVISKTACVPEDNPNRELVNKLRSLTQGKSYHSESDYPIDVFFWNIKAIGEFELENFLVKINRLVTIKLDKFWQDIQLDNPSLEQQYIWLYQNTIKPIEKYIDSLEIYKLISSPLCEYFNNVEVYVLLAKTKLGDWLTISLQLNGCLEQDEVLSSPVFEIKDNAITKPEYLQLIITLENTIEITNKQLPKKRNGADYIDGLTWHLAADRDLAIQNTLIATRHFNITECHPVKIFGEKENKLLTENLMNKRKYYIGTANIDIYLIGQTVSKDWIVIHTQVVST